MNRREAIKRTTLLTGGAISIPVLSSVLQGCRATGKIDWKPSFFTLQEARVIGQMADIILPRTDSPSASDVHVPEFIDLMISDCLTTEQQKVFRNELTDFIANFKNTSGKPFESAPLANQSFYMKEMDSLSFHDPSTKPSFYRTLKQLTLLGYFTSEKVMTEHSNYHSIAGRYDACIPYDGSGTFVDNNVEGRL